MDGAEGADCLAAVLQVDLGASAVEVHGLAARAHTEGVVGHPEHRHDAIDEAVDDLEAGGRRVREDDGEAAAVRGTHVLTVTRARADGIWMRP